MCTRRQRKSFLSSLNTCQHQAQPRKFIGRWRLNFPKSIYWVWRDWLLKNFFWYGENFRNSSISRVWRDWKLTKVYWELKISFVGLKFFDGPHGKSLVWGVMVSPWGGVYFTKVENQKEWLIFFVTKDYVHHRTGTFCSWITQYFEGKNKASFFCSDDNLLLSTQEDYS